MNKKLRHIRENKESVDYVLTHDENLKNSKYEKLLNVVLKEDKTLENYFQYVFELIKDLENENIKLRDKLFSVNKKINAIIKGLNKK